MSDTKPTDLLVWTDAETTGLDLRRDQILELAMTVTDTDLNRLGSISPLVQPHTHRTFADWVDHLDPYVRDMHRGTGLLNELGTRWGMLHPVAEVDRLTAQWLQQVGERSVGEPYRLVVCGSGTERFDRQLIERDMPATWEILHYAGADLSSVRMFASWWKPELYDALHWPRETIPHRASGDVEMELQQAEALRRWLLMAPQLRRGPTSAMDSLTGGMLESLQSPGGYPDAGV